MLLEELLGISNKRLKGIFIGKPQEDDTSSTDEEEEKSPDVISLDDVTDDDFIIDLDSGKYKKSFHSIRLFIILCYCFILFYKFCIVS